MKNTLVISMTPEGYSLTQPIKENDKINYHKILRGGTEKDLINSLSRFPLEFYKEGVILSFNYDNESAPIKIPQHKRDELENLVALFGEAENLFD